MKSQQQIWIAFFLDEYLRKKNNKEIIGVSI